LPKPAILGLMAVFNEADILDQSLKYHIDNGFEFLVLDNGSTDDSRAIAESYVGRGVIAVRKVVTETYRWGYLLDTLLEWSEAFAPRWCFLVDADTFLEPPRHGQRLVQAVADVEAQGCNVINCDHFEFWPTGEERADVIDVRQRLNYYTWADDRQEKGWLACPGTRNSRLGGHEVDFPASVIKRVYPEKFVLRHYRIRSYEHGMRKVFSERLPRFAGEPSNWHTHYVGFRGDRSYFEIPKESLTRRIEGEPWNREPRFHGWEAKRVVNGQHISRVPAR
jgi:glycosyltransferase involved in cell wall biosynthesis